MKQGKSQLKIGIILNYINMILGNLIPVFYTPVMLHLLGQQEYGLYKLAGSVTSYLSLISLGIGSAVSRYVIKAETEGGKETEERYLGLFMIIFQIIAVASLLVGSGIALNLQRWYSASLTIPELERMKTIVLILVCNTALSFLLSPYISVVSSHERFVFLQCMNILSTCVAPIINLIVLFCGYKSIGMSLASLGTCVVSRIMYLFYVRKVMDIHPRYKNLPLTSLKEILSFSFWVFMATIVSKLYSTTDTVMIGAVPALGTIGVAIYNVGGVFNNIVLSLTTGITNMLTPRANRMVFSGASLTELTDLAIRVGRLQGFIITLLVSGFISFGRPFISFYAGDGYKEAYWVAIFMMIPSMIPLVQSVCLSIIVAMNKHKFRAIVYLFIAITNVIGTWFLMRTKLGIVGAALMTGIATLAGQGLVMNWYYGKKIGLEMKRFWASLGKLYIIPAILCCITLICSRWIDLGIAPVMFTGIIIYTFIYCLLSSIFIMNDYEKHLILNPVKQALHLIKRHG